MTEDSLFKSAMESALIQSEKYEEFMIERVEELLKRTLTEGEELILLYGFTSGMTLELFKRLKKEPDHKYN